MESSFKLFRRRFSSLAPKQWNSLPSDIRHIYFSHALKTVKNSPIQTIPQVISNSVFLLASPIYPPSPLVIFLLCARVCGGGVRARARACVRACVCACVCVCVCVCVRGIQYYGYIICYFSGFNIYIIVGLVKRGSLTLVGEITDVEKMTATVIIVIETHRRPG